MARSIRMSEPAIEQLRDLPRDRSLLKVLFRRIEEAADDPDRFTEPAVYPFRADRRMSNFAAYDTAGKRWGFTVLFAVSDDAVEVKVIRGAQYDLPPELDTD